MQPTHPKKKKRTIIHTYCCAHCAHTCVHFMFWNAQCAPQSATISAYTLPFSCLFFASVHGWRVEVHHFVSDWKNIHNLFELTKHVNDILFIALVSKQWTVATREQLPQCTFPSHSFILIVTASVDTLSPCSGADLLGHQKRLQIQSSSTSPEKICKESHTSNSTVFPML